MNANLPSDVKCVKTAVKENIPDNWRFCLESVASDKATSAVDRVPNYSTLAPCCDEILQRKDTQILNYVCQVVDISFLPQILPTMVKETENPRQGVIVRVHRRSRDFFQMYRVMEVTFVYTIEITQNLTVE